MKNKKSKKESGKIQKNFPARRNFLGSSKASHPKGSDFQLSKITKNMSFSEIIEKNPEAVEILMEKGMHCIGCGMAPMETFEQGALVHGMNPDELIEEINKKIKK